MMRRLVVLSMAGILAFTSCGSARFTHRPHVLRIAFAGDPNSLVPFLAIDQDVIALDTFFAETLVGLDAHNRDIPLLVTRVPTRANGDVSSNGKQITYHLRRDVRFADGVPFTSADVAFTYRAVLDPRNRATLVEPYKRIVKLETPDAHTVVIRLQRPWNAAVHVFFAQSDYPYGILPQHAFKDTRVVGTPWENAPFGTGPFRVTEWRRGDRIVLEPNLYFRPKPKLAQIVLQIIPNLNSNYVALEAGSADVGILTPDNIERASGIAHVRVSRIPENGTGQLYMQTHLTPTNELAVRKAIALAIDLKELSGAWRAEYPTASAFLPPPIVSWNHAPIAAYPHDLKTANRLLDDAGWHMSHGVRTKGAQPLAGVIGANSENPISVRIATILQSQLALIGMRLDVKTNPSSLWFSQEGLLRNGKASMVSESWVGGGDPEQSLNLRCVEAIGGGSNHSFYCSRRFEELFADQARTPSETQRHRDFDAIQQLVHDDIPVIPLYYETYFEGVDRRVVHYERNMLRIPVHAEQWDTL
ncbi:MAG: ABC transporter substrate-binding protein [Candidatus Eremiobacteraeota bacterium]|nr:ABC transporter substrate-binding protein [Candidatus Eremiobacteraeota bacterium]